jgi:hypothetical protein
VSGAAETLRQAVRIVERWSKGSVRRVVFGRGGKEGEAYGCFLRRRGRRLCRGRWGLSGAF